MVATKPQLFSLAISNSLGVYEFQMEASASAPSVKPSRIIEIMLPDQWGPIFITGWRKLVMCLEQPSHVLGAPAARGAPWAGDAAENTQSVRQSTGPGWPVTVTPTPQAVVGGQLPSSEICRS